MKSMGPALNVSGRYLVRYINQQPELFESFAQAAATSLFARMRRLKLANIGEPTLW